jgi:hypothetical protein
VSTRRCPLQLGGRGKRGRPASAHCKCAGGASAAWFDRPASRRSKCAEGRSRPGWTAISRTFGFAS